MEVSAIAPSEPGRQQGGRLLYANASSNEDGAFDLCVIYGVRRPDKAAPDSYVDLLSEDVFGRLPQPGSWRVVGALLDGEFEERLVARVRSRPSLTGGGCQGEAAGLGDARYVDVEPLSWLELSPSATVENSRKGRGRYVDCVLLAQSKFERP